MDRDAQLGFLPLQDDAAADLLVGVPEPERDATWHLRSPDGATVGYGRGGRELLTTLRLTRPLGRALRLVPDAALDAAYRLVARHRSRLGRVVPDGPAPHRYP